MAPKRGSKKAIKKPGHTIKLSTHGKASSSQPARTSRSRAAKAKAKASPSASPEVTPPPSPKKVTPPPSPEKVAPPADPEKVAPPADPEKVTLPANSKRKRDDDSEFEEEVESSDENDDEMPEMAEKTKKAEKAKKATPPASPEKAKVSPPADPEKANYDDDSDSEEDVTSFELVPAIDVSTDVPVVVFARIPQGAYKDVEITRHADPLAKDANWVWLNKDLLVPIGEVDGNDLVNVIFKATYLHNCERLYNEFCDASTKEELQQAKAALKEKQMEATAMQDTTEFLEQITGQNAWQDGLSAEKVAEFFIKLKNNAYDFKTVDVEKFSDRLCVLLQCHLMVTRSNDLGELPNTEAEIDWKDECRKLRNEVSKKRSPKKKALSDPSPKAPSPKAPSPKAPSEPSPEVMAPLDEADSEDSSDDDDEEIKSMKALHKENLRKIAAKAEKKRRRKLARWRALVAQSTAAVAGELSSVVSELPNVVANEADRPFSDSAPANPGVAGAEKDKEDNLGDEKPLMDAAEPPKDGEQRCDNWLVYTRKDGSEAKEKCGRPADKQYKIPGPGTDAIVCMQQMLSEEMKNAGIKAGEHRCKMCGKHQQRLINGAKNNGDSPEVVKQLYATHSAKTVGCTESPDYSVENRNALYDHCDATEALGFKKNFTEKEIEDCNAARRDSLDKKKIKNANAAAVKKVQQALKGLPKA